MPPYAGMNRHVVVDVSSAGEGLATHSELELCTAVRKFSRKALIKECMGQVLSRESILNQGADAVEDGGRQHSSCRKGETRWDSARSVDPEHVPMQHAREPGDPVFAPARKERGRVVKSKDVRQ